MKYFSCALAFAFVTQALPAYGQTIYNRFIEPNGIELMPLGSGMFDVNLKIHCANQTNVVLNMGMDVKVSVNSVLVTTLPAQSIIGGGGGQTCNGSCNPGDCSANGPDSTCAQFSVFGGQGCACTTVIYVTALNISISPGDTVNVELVPATMAVPEVFQIDDIASVVLRPAYNRFISADDVRFIPAGGGLFGAEITAHCASLLQGPLDLSMRAGIYVNAILVDSIPMPAIVPGGGQTCGGSCTVPVCPVDSSCAQFSDFGGVGCTCTTVIVGQTAPSSIAVAFGDIVNVNLVEAANTPFEIYLPDDRVSFPFAGPVGVPYCQPMDANCTGLSTLLTDTLIGFGSTLHLEASQGPPSQFGFFLVGAGPSDPGLSLSRGRLCLSITGGNVIGRYSLAGGSRNSLGSFNNNGVFINLVGTSAQGSGFDVPSSLPFAGNPLIVAGSTWYFQLWHRDPCPQPGDSNFSNALEVTF